MKVFIFGAGASYDAQHGVVHDNAIPPLTNDLFDPRYKEFATKVGISEPDMNNYRNSLSGFAYFEEWLTSEWNRLQEIKTIPARDAQRGFLAQVAFYIWLTLVNVSKWTYENQYQSRENNAYVTLMNKIRDKDEDFGLINFNYDLLLDYAYKDSFRLVFHNIDDYLNNNYVKPHGSVNWLLSKRDDDLSIILANEHNMDTKTRLDTAIKLMFRDSPIPIEGLLVKDPNHRDLYVIDDLLRSYQSQYFYPLIFLPITSKAYSSVSGFEDKVISKANKMISEAQDIYLVGYRANDDIIKAILSHAGSGTKLHIVGVDSSNEIMKRVLDGNPNLHRGEVFDKGFYHFAYNTAI